MCNIVGNPDFPHKQLGDGCREHLPQGNTVPRRSQRNNGTLSGSCSQWPPTHVEHRHGALRQKQHQLKEEKKRQKPHDSTVQRNDRPSWDRGKPMAGCCGQLRCCSVVKFSVWHTYQADMSHSLAAIQGGFSTIMSIKSNGRENKWLLFACAPKCNWSGNLTTQQHVESVEAGKD